MLKDILPDFLNKSVSLLKYEELCEIRMRMFMPIKINYKNAYYFLGQAGITDESNAIICTEELIKNVLSKASNFSIYSVNDELKQGFLSVKDGIRIGIAGQVVMNCNEILTIKNISALNIRIPHQVMGSSYAISKLIFDMNGNLLNTMILGSPGTGKTTIIRDLCYQVCKYHKDINILLLDERMEIASCFNGIPELNVGGSTDIISGGKKSTNISSGIRSMSPNLIVIDEIGTMDDVGAIEYAVNCGVNVVATIHSKNIYELQRKQELKNLIQGRLFLRYVEISSNKGKGTIENIYDSSFKSLLRTI